MSRPIGSLSLDLDNLWSYQKVQGNPAWRAFPSFLDLAVPRILEYLASRRLTITFFIVGEDAAREACAEPLAAIARAGHEIGNHSFHHEPWVASVPFADADREIARAHEAIALATGREPAGFRGPGFATSPALLLALRSRGYRYDASCVPTFIGPLARWYYFRAAKSSAQERRQRAALFGAWHDVLKPNRAHVQMTQAGSIVEVPVTTMPFARLPIHLSYLHYMEGFSPALADRYFRAALALCRATGTVPSLLLHPLDFLGGDEVPELRFFPAMNRTGEQKHASTVRFVDEFARNFDIIPLARHAAAVAA